MAKDQLVELAGQMEAEAGTHKWEIENGSNEQLAAMLLEPSAALGTLLLRSEEPVQHIEAGKKFLEALNVFLDDFQNHMALDQMNGLGDRTVDSNIAKIIKSLAKL